MTRAFHLKKQNPSSYSKKKKKKKKTGKCFHKCFTDCCVDAFVTNGIVSTCIIR